jgi:hypothetical protein
MQDPLPRDLYELKKAEAKLFERQFILARDSLIDIHCELISGNIYDNSQFTKLLKKIEINLEALGVTQNQGEVKT